MKITIASLVLSLAVPAAAAAQAPAPSTAPAQPVRHTFLPAHTTKLSVDFGAKKALKNLPQPQVRCEAVRKHQHELLPAGKGSIGLSIPGRHGLGTAPAAPCSVR
jgi:hypothetical protein